MHALTRINATIGTKHVITLGHALRGAISFANDKRNKRVRSRVNLAVNENNSIRTPRVSSRIARDNDRRGRRDPGGQGSVERFTDAKELVKREHFPRETKLDERKRGEARLDGQWDLWGRRINSSPVPLYTE